MQQFLTCNEQMVLEYFASQTQPCGSWALVEALEQKGIEISSATASRVLKKLERLGLLKKVQSRGRVITLKGLEVLEKEKIINDINYYKLRLDNLVDSTMLEEYISILEAREAIESKTAKLAAKNITENEINALENILQLQHKKHLNNESIAEEDIRFHRVIAKASRNPALESLYNIISTYGQQSKIFEQIRVRVNAKIMVSHQGILDAIKRRSEAQASLKMSEHINSLIHDVYRYSNEFIHGAEKNGSENANTIICRCEEITEADIVEAIHIGATTIKEIKRWTRAGMGLCQGRTCRKLLEGIISRETGTKLEDVDPPSHRIPVRPLKAEFFKNK